MCAGGVISGELVLTGSSDAWVGVSRLLVLWRTRVAVSRYGVVLDTYLHLSRKSRSIMQGSWMLAYQRDPWVNQSDTRPSIHQGAAGGRLKGTVHIVQGSNPGVQIVMKEDGGRISSVALKYCLRHQSVAVVVLLHGPSLHGERDVSVLLTLCHKAAATVKLLFLLITEIASHQ